MAQTEKIVIDQAHDALIVVDVQPTFMPGGGLPVAGGDRIVPVVNQLLRGFHHDRRIATKDRHPRGHISLASSFVGFDPMTTITHKAWGRRADGSGVAELKVEVSVPGKEMSTKGLRQSDLAKRAKFSIEDLNEYLEVVGSQVLWPDHAIAGTDEANLHRGIDPFEEHIFAPEAAFGYVLVKGLDPACDSYSGFFDNLHRPTELADVLRDRGVRRVFVCGLAFDFCVGWTALDAVECGFESYVVRDATRAVDIPPGPASPGSVDFILAEFERVGVKVIDSTDLVIAA